MYHPHPSIKLKEIFTAKPYQGIAPEQASFLFIGLDANYDAAIESHAIFPLILEYHRDGVAFWQKHGVHHPFLLSGYTGDGKLYHRSFARIGFQPEHAGLVSFAELLHVPTTGRNKLEIKDLSRSHLNKLNTAITKGKAKYIFIPAGVAQLMIQTGAFPWLQKKPLGKDGPLDILYRHHNKTVYKHLHFSNYGKFEEQKQHELAYVGGLLAKETKR
jgi:hypothetical protein